MGLLFYLDLGGYEMGVRQDLDELDEIGAKSKPDGEFMISNLMSAINSIVEERQRQDAKWGRQDHDPTVWLGILGEEFGELCQAVNETWFDNGPEERQKGGYVNMRKEAVQVAAVAVSLIECLDRRHGGNRI